MPRELHRLPTVALDFAPNLQDDVATSAAGYDLVLPDGGPTKRSDRSR